MIGEAEKWDGVKAGIASVAEVLDSPSYKAAEGERWQDDHAEPTTEWLPNADSLLVLAMHHPVERPELDWFDRGNTAGNRRLTKISEVLVKWLRDTHGIMSQALPYQVERGGVFLKDAACLAGLGVIGKNNLLINREWGPNVRLRSILVQELLPATAPLEDFDPCDRCGMPCHKACPKNALVKGQYNRSSCMPQLESDRGNPIRFCQEGEEDSPLSVTAWCRRCEFACPAGT